MLPSGLPDQIDGDENLARFLTQSNRFTSVMAKPAAFLPRPKDRETSVSRHGSQPLESLWSIGLNAAGERTLYGAAIFKAHVVRRVQLQVIAAEPPPRHAALRGWPWLDDPVLQKARQLELASVLAREAELLLR